LKPRAVDLLAVNELLRLSPAQLAKLARAESGKQPEPQRLVDPSDGGRLVPVAGAIADRPVSRAVHELFRGSPERHWLRGP
jgi:hypothetical protein